MYLGKIVQTYSEGEKMNVKIKVKSIDDQKNSWQSLVVIV